MTEHPGCIPLVAGSALRRAGWSHRCRAELNRPQGRRSSSPKGNPELKSVSRPKVDHRPGV
jgi:hypothetical protein